MNLTTALRMHTINGAFASFEDDIKGSLEQGKLADLTVLSEKIEDVPVTELRDLPVDMTIVGGRIAYER